MLEKMARGRQRIIRIIKGLLRKREPLNLTAVKRRHPRLLKSVYAVRPFWGWKQALADAGIDYAKINVDLDDACECRVCGAELGILTVHLLRVHELTPEEYRRDFPGAEIMAETVRAARMRAHTRLPHWEPVWSWEYALDRAWEFHRRGWSLNCADVQRRERPLFNFIWSSGRKWDEVIEALGLDPAEIRRLAPGESLTRADVVGRLKKRRAEGKAMADSALARDDLRLLNAARRRFGSYPKALRAAGLRPESIRLRTPRITAGDLARLGREMRRVAALHGPKRVSAARALKRKYRHTVADHFGSWAKACRKFGVKPEDLAWSPYSSRKHVIEGLRRWAKIPGAHPEQLYREDRALVGAAYRFLGSWTKALKAAGVSFPDLRKSRNVATRRHEVRTK